MEVCKVFLKKFVCKLWGFCVLGFVAATTLMLFPINSLTENPDKIVVNLIIYAVCIVCGAVASFFFSVACNNIKASVAEKEEQ